MLFNLLQQFTVNVVMVHIGEGELYNQLKEV